MPQVWAVTGVSGCGRIEFLDDLKEYAKKREKVVKVFDVGVVIQQKAIENNVAFVLDRILNLDRTTLSLLRALAVQTINQEISQDNESDVIFIGMHALFTWKNRLIPGVSYSDLLSIKLDGIINLVDDVITIQKVNALNPKWAKGDMPSPASLQKWMMEEELLSDVFASIKGVPMFVLARNQKMENVYKLFFENMKKIYLSFPITAIRDDSELLKTIQEGYKPRLEELFYVFNPLDIMDKTHVANKTTEAAELDGFLSRDNIDLIDARTIERDFRFIAQSDAVVVIYPTDKLSPGVSAEMNYAYAHQIPVYMLFPGKVSPFLAEIANVYHDQEEFFAELNDFAYQGHQNLLIE